VARKLDILMFGLWRDGTHYQYKADAVLLIARSCRQRGSDQCHRNVAGKILPGRGVFGDFGSKIRAAMTLSYG